MVRFRPLCAMRRLLAAVTVPLAVIGFVVVPAGSAAAAADVTHGNRLVVSGFTTTTSQDGCLSASTSIFGDAEEVGYFFSSFNRCTGEGQLYRGDGVPDVFKVKGDLASVHVVATIVLRNNVTGEPLGGVVKLDNTWTASDKPVTFRSDPMTNVPGQFLFLDRSRVAFAPATVTGTVPLSTADISQTSSVTVIVNHG
jgi:hypothetical protein